MHTYFPPGLFWASCSYHSTHFQFLMPSQIAVPSSNFWGGWQHELVEGSMSLSSATNPTIGGSYRFVCGKTGGRPEKSGDLSAEDQQGTKKARNRRTEGLGGHERILTMQSALPSCKCTFLSEQPPNRLIAKLLKHQGEWWEGRSLRCPRLPSPHKRFKANNQNKTSTNARLRWHLF